MDTHLAQAAGSQTEEVTGGCFCCRMSELIAAADRLGRIEDGRLSALGVQQDQRWVMVKPELVATTVFAHTVPVAAAAGDTAAGDAAAAAAPAGMAKEPRH